MKHTIFIICIITLFSSCNQGQSKKNNFIEQIRDDFVKQAEEHNKKVNARERKIKEIYNRADRNLIEGVNYADSILKNDKSLDKGEVWEINTIVGEIYYDNDSIDLALERFNKEEYLAFRSPRNQANKAGCYVKKGNFKKAMELLEQAADLNKDFKWYIGNLYEIKGEPENAIKEYSYVYQRDTTVYAYYNKRIQEIKNNPDQLMSDLEYKDRRKRNLLLLNAVDSSANELEIGGIEIKNK